LTYSDGNPSWANGWEAMSHAGAKPRHAAGWRAGDTGSLITPRSYQKLAGQWVDGVDPASRNRSG